jgi:cellulose synthase/poly-beta-1,6-N-acetylglucosamine synthase-like glycosyltransferase
MQVHRKGFKVCYVPAAQVYTQDPGNLKDYHKQVLRWYRGFWQVVKKHDVFSFKKKQKVDWYIMLITLDALIFNRIFGLIFLLLFSPALIPTVLTLDLALAFLVSCYAGYRTKRLDIIYKFPVYYWLSYVNFYAYIRSFVEIVLQKKELLAWNKVQRYNFDSNTQ